MIRTFFANLRHRKACKALQADVDKRRGSFEVQAYTRNRAAALKATRPDGEQRRRERNRALAAEL